MAKMNLGILLQSHNGARWVLLDFLIGVAAMVSGLVLTPYVDVYEVYNRAIVSVSYGIALVLCVRLCGLYAHRMQHLFSRYDILLGSLQASLFAFITIGLIVNFSHVHVFGRYVAASVIIISFVCLSCTRMLAKFYLERNPLRIAILGCSESSREFGERVAGDPHFEVVYVACQQACDNPLILERFGFHQFDDVNLFAKQLSEENVEIVVSCYESSIPSQVYDLVELLPFSHIDFLNKGAFLEFFFREVSVSYRNLHWQGANFFKPARGAVTSMKRLIDIGVSVPALLATLPLWFLVMILVKLDSKGPAFYSQTRVGLLGRPFEIFKFRTMTTEAEKNGAQWATKGDTRVTRVGAFLRKTRLDELPQLWNVLKGDMSLVGPRPERPEFVELLKQEIPLYEWRYLVKPGLTGWAQILFKYGESVADARRKLQYDLFYIKNFCITLDLQILIRTIPLIMKGSQ
ncbi:sugar transferase [Coraliomargarita sp. SDUM461003]|uniref:Sugar transferase n=1 Tax=Thalassobacterium maritimum TaxID=3041265 RepID=A0ABU1AWL7_9BACT|nr:sugar transferase [Coraliomargarita sp. SDUM461003]MDQ8208541.1 sugar transferase [Coraliomargarita sp. SDUM461003]